MNSRGYLQISFAWLFAIIVGAVIISLAIFAATKILKGGQTEIDAETAKKIGVLLNPLESSFESGTSASFSIPIETRIYTRCDSSYGTFGRQSIAVAQKNFNQWSTNETYVGFQNKYLFLEDGIEGKEFYLFSEPFYFPFKIADLIYVLPSSRIYCFENTQTQNIIDDVGFFGQKNLLIENCSDNPKAVQVCESFSCDIVLDLTKKDVIKNGEKIHYEEDALMYAAIFSEKKLYNCQISRLMKRAEKLAELYEEKSSIISKSGCVTNFDPQLAIFRLGVKNVVDGRGLIQVAGIEELIKEKNFDATCKLW